MRIVHETRTRLGLMLSTGALIFTGGAVLEGTGVLSPALKAVRQALPFMPHDQRIYEPPSLFQQLPQDLQRLSDGLRKQYDQPDYEPPQILHE